MKMKEKLKFLHIDTSDDLITSVICFSNGKVKKYEASESKSHLKYLVPLIKKALDENSLELKELDFISINEGPGSWTGLRIGVSTVKVLCMINKLKLITINNFDLMRNTESFATGLYLIRCSQINYYFRFYQKAGDNEFKEGVVSEEKVSTEWEGADKFYLSAPSHELLLTLIWEKFSKENFSHPDSLEPYYLTDGNLISNFKVASK